MRHDLIDHHRYPRVPAMNDDQLAAAQGFFRDNDGDLVTITSTFSASVRVSVFKDDRLCAGADITADGVVVDHLLGETV